MATESITPENTTILSLLHGPANPPLLDLTLGELLDFQCERYGSRECLVIPWTGARWTYDHLKQESMLLAQTLVARGVQHGDRIGIMAECKILFTTSNIGPHDNRKLLAKLKSNPGTVEEIVILRGNSGPFTAYNSFLKSAAKASPDEVIKRSKMVRPYDVCNLQFTSGTTGHPKAAMLTHHNLVNNSRFIGDRMAFTEEDVLCCPPPLFHCFGLVLGLLAVVTHGAKIVYPTEVFNAAACLKAISDEKCTGLHGVPAMFDSIFSLPRPENFDASRLRTGIIAGAPVPRNLMELLVEDLGMTEFTSSYGLTEASPTCFNAYHNDTIERRLTTVGNLMPHAHAKVVDRDGKIVPVGVRGELCIAGYQLQAGYWKNPEKTAEVMKRDENGILWLHTGDEVVFHPNGTCTITGRFKDIIIRGGENIYPLEVEERLTKHSAVDRAIVIGVKHERYGEVVGAFLQRDAASRKTTARPTDDELRDWTRMTLGRHKAPVHIFWLGEDGVPENIPLTGSGKVKKYEMTKLAEQLLVRRRPKL